jgi:hypothetical protein
VDGAVVGWPADELCDHAVHRLDGAGDDNGVGAGYLGVGFGVDRRDCVYVYGDGCERGGTGSGVGCVNCGDSNGCGSSWRSNRGGRESGVRSGVGVVGRAGEQRWFVDFELHDHAVYRFVGSDDVAGQWFGVVGGRHRVGECDGLYVHGGGDERRGDGPGFLRVPGGNA